MGKRGPLPKPNAERAGHRTKAELAAAEPMVLAAVVALPAATHTPPRGLLKATRGEWAAYWTSPLSRLCDVSAEPALERLFRLRDERERYRRVVRKAGVVVLGPRGGEYPNPLLREIDSLDRRIAQLEDRFGMNPGAALRLGIAFGDARASLEELNRQVNADDDDADDDDPRLAAVREPARDS